MSDIVKLIQESIVFNDRTISVDFDKFLSGEIKKLLIFGFSAIRGKITRQNSIGNSIEKLYNLTCYYNDDCYIKHREEHKFVKCIKEMILNKNKHIVEGMNMLGAYSLEKHIKNKPCIILGRSALVESYKSAKKLDLPFVKTFKHLSTLTIEYNNDYTKFKKFRTSQPNANVQDFKLSNLSSDDIQWKK
jgi:hypothetical protein